MPPPSKPAPTATADPRSTPEALARALHRSVAENDAIAMMHLSMLGAPTNAWIDFSGKMFRNSLKLLEKNLADLEAAKPRNERSEAEQLRIINLHTQREQMSNAYTNSMKRLSIELPQMRERFLQRGFLDVVLQFKAAGVDPAQLTVSRVDTAAVTDTYQGIAMRGGALTVWFAREGIPQDFTLTLVVAQIDNHGWVFVQDPKVNAAPIQGPAPEATPEPR